MEINAAYSDMKLPYESESQPCVGHSKPSAYLGLANDKVRPGHNPVVTTRLGSLLQHVFLHIVKVEALVARC